MSFLKELPVRALCHLFCCPPCPARIMSKLAFLPPSPSYTFEVNTSDSNLRMCVPHLNEPSMLNNIEVFNVTTSRGHHISCMYVKSKSTTSKTLLCSHGNSCDLGYISPHYIELATQLDCNILGYDYSGYGQSGGKPSERNMYVDIEAAWKAAQTRYGLEPKDVILYGQSLGTVPTVDLASKTDVAGVVLVSPLMSGMRVVFPAIKRTWCFDAFSSIDKVQKISSPVLVIHGTKDEIIALSHGKAIVEKCTHAVEPLFLKGVGHNFIETEDAFVQRILRFINEELES